MAVIQAGRAPGAPPGPRLNPSAFGGEGEAMQRIAGIVLQEADRRIEQGRASRLATARANAMVQTDELVASIADNPDFNAHQDLWRTGYAQIEATAQAAVGDDWVALAPDMIRLGGDGSSRVTARSHMMEDDYNVAALLTSTRTMIESAQLPGIDHEARMDLMGQMALDAADSGMISQEAAVRMFYANREEYLGAMNAGAIDRDPEGWLNSHSTTTNVPVGAAAQAGDANAPRGVQLNNPLNIRISGNEWQGRAAVNPDSEFEAFVNPQSGIRAAVLNLRSYQNRGIATIGEAIATWAPAGDGANDPNAYANRVAELSGLAPSTPLNTNDYDQMQRLIPAMVVVEQGMQPYEPAVYREGLQLAGVTGAGSVVGTSAGDDLGTGVAVVAPLVPGNIDLNNRPVVPNPEGGVSTVYSMSIGTDQGEVLIPRVSDDGRILTEPEAIALYEQTGRHLGIFDTAEHATAYAEQLHEDQEQQYAQPGGAAATIPVRQHQPIPGLSIAQQDALFGRAEGLVNERLAATQESITGRIQDEEAFLMSGGVPENPVNVSDIAAAFPLNPAHAQALTESLTATRAVAGEIQSMHDDMTNPEIQALVAGRQAELQSTSVNYVQRAAQFEALRLAGTGPDGIITQRTDNPAAYALQHNPSLAADFEQSFGPDGTNEGRAAALRAMADVQRGYQTGVAPELLPDQFATSLLDQYNQSTDPRARVDLLASVTTALGDDVAGEVVMDQLVAAGVHPEMREIVDLNTRDPNRAAFYASLVPNLAESVQEFDDALQGTTGALAIAETEILTPYQTRAAVYFNRGAIVGDIGETDAMRREEQDAYMRLVKAAAMRQGGETGTVAEQVYRDFYGNEAAISEDVGFAFIDQATAPQVMAGMEAVLTDLLPTIVTPDYIAAAAAFEIPAGDRQIAADTIAALLPDARFVNHGETETGDKIFAIAMPIRNDDDTVEQPMMLHDSNGNLMTWTAAELQAASVGDLGQRGGGGLRPPPTAQPPSEPTFTPIPNAPQEQRSPPGVQQETWNGIAADQRMELGRILLAYEGDENPQIREWIASHWMDMSEEDRDHYRRIAE